jgi:hypothetical protein
MKRIFFLLALVFIFPDAKTRQIYLLMELLKIQKKNIFISTNLMLILQSLLTLQK